MRFKTISLKIFGNPKKTLRAVGLLVGLVLLMELIILVLTGFYISSSIHSWFLFAVLLTPAVYILLSLLRLLSRVSQKRRGIKNGLGAILVSTMILVYVCFCIPFFTLLHLRVHWDHLVRATHYPSPDGRRELVFRDEMLGFHSCDIAVYERRGWFEKEADLKIISDVYKLEIWRDFTPCNVFHNSRNVELRWHENAQQVRFRVRVEDDMSEDMLDAPIVEGIVIFD